MTSVAAGVTYVEAPAPADEFSAFGSPQSADAILLLQSREGVFGSAISIRRTAAAESRRALFGNRVMFCRRPYVRLIRVGLPSTVVLGVVSVLPVTVLLVDM